MLADGCSNKSGGANFFNFPGTLVIRDDSRVVYLSGKDQEAKKYEEGLVKAQLYVELIEKYKYPLSAVEFGRYVKVGAKDSRHYIEADAIVGDSRGNIRMILEVSAFSDWEKNMDAVVADLFLLCAALSWIKKPEYLVYFSRSCKSGSSKEKIMTVDCSKFNTFAAWKKAGRPGGKAIPGNEE